jgi:aminoglycoside phosphotransferase
MGIVDVAHLGVGDRHRDLAIVVRAWIANFGSELAWRVTDAYGMPYPDGVRLEWYRIADDLA